MLNTEVVQDDIDRYPTQILYTPALTEDCSPRPCSGARGGPTTGSSSTMAMLTSQPSNVRSTRPFQRERWCCTTSPHRWRPKRSEPSRPRSLRFGLRLIAALAALFVSLQAISRQLQSQSDEREVLRAVGGDAWMTAADGLIGIVGSIVVGSLLAVVVAIALVAAVADRARQAVYPDPGISFDWLVLGLGSALLIVALVGVSVGLAIRNNPDRVARREQQTRERPSLGVRRDRSWPAGACRRRVALCACARDRQVVRARRSAMFGALVAVVTVVATLTFGSSLQTLVAHPISTDGTGPTPFSPFRTQSALSQQRSRPLVKATPMSPPGPRCSSSLSSSTVRPSPSCSSRQERRSPPRSCRGTPSPGRDQLVLGPATLADLHKQVGDTVEASYEGQHEPCTSWAPRHFRPSG